MPTQLIRALLNIKAGAAFKMTSMKARLAARAGVHLYIYMYVTFFINFPCISWIFGFTLEVYGFPKPWAQGQGPLIPSTLSSDHVLWVKPDPGPWGR